MSLSELLVIAFIAILLVKPEDFPRILKKFKEFREFFNNTKKELLSHIELNDGTEELNEDLNQMNFYLQKITEFDGEYRGEYNLVSIKKYYYSLIKKKIKDQEDNLL